ncbi:hypothetical protein [Williamsia serinedens]|uniref:TrbL/VirB6 plasmid conjugal transfer protein n=1 Tax=Williamsia serinedens TaxID=391736 RepID=A0ABT1H759_9NOCA|nr:hypothetical protein [Williamsia serinedens]MCP2163071.1 hypothetical protein [Williamsia serinedens]
MRTTTVRLLAVLLAACAALALGGGTAAAAPDSAAQPGQTSTTAGSLPKGFPDDLKQFIGGTPEFKRGPWFSGACANRGGDFGMYLSKMFPVENRLRYWALDADGKAALLIGYTQTQQSVARGFVDNPPVNLIVDGQPKTVAGKDQIAKAITDGATPASDDVYGKTFPNDNAEFYPPAPTCADDLARWTSKASTTWGMNWVGTPDDASRQAMIAAGAPDASVTDPCGMDTKRGGWAYCAHAMFVNCDKADRGDDLARCRDWNLGIGRMFAGTKDWIDRNTSFGDRVDDAIRSTPEYREAKALADAFTAVYQFSKKVVAFVKDPGNVIDDWANDIKEWAVSTTQAVLRGLVSVGEFNVGTDWFLSQYAIAAGLGVAVMSIMFITLAARAARPRGRHGGTSELVGVAFGYLPAGLLAMMFAPAVIAVLQPLTHGLTEFFAQAIGSKTDETVNNVSATLGGLTKDTLVGGTIAGIIGFLLLGLGAFALYIGLLMHQIGLPLAGIISAICWGMWIHPKWRAKALRPALMFLSLMLSTPLLFLCIGVIEDVINSAAKSSMTGDGDLKSLGQLALMGLAFFVLGLAPFSLLKWAPILPSAEDADRMGDSGAGSGAIAGAGMGAGLSAARGPHRSVGSGAATNSAAASSPGASSHSGNTGSGGHAPSAASSPISPSGGGHGGGGGHHGGSAAAGAGGKAMTGAGGKAALGAAGGLATGGLVTTAALLGSAAQGGSRAAAISAMNRIHGTAADSAPTTDQ